MSTSGSDTEIPDKPTVSSEIIPTPTKPKRQMSEKQLANLAKARAVARVKLGEKKVRTSTLKSQQKKLKELRLKEQEDRVQAELNSIRAVNLQGEKDPGPVKIERVGRKKKKEPKVIYYSSSSEDTDSPEIVYRKKTRKKKVRVQAHPPTTIHAPVQTAPPPVIKQQDVNDAQVANRYNQEMNRLRAEMLMDSVFPNF